MPVAIAISSEPSFVLLFCVIFPGRFLSDISIIAAFYPLVKDKITFFEHILYSSIFRCFTIAFIADIRISKKYFSYSPINFSTVSFSNYSFQAITKMWPIDAPKTHTNLLKNSYFNQPPQGLPHLVPREPVIKYIVHHL